MSTPSVVGKKLLCYNAAGGSMFSFYILFLFHLVKGFTGFWVGLGVR